MRAMPAVTFDSGHQVERLEDRNVAETVSWGVELTDCNRCCADV